MDQQSSRRRACDEEILMEHGHVPLPSLCPSDALAASDPSSTRYGWSLPVQMNCPQLFRKYLHNRLARQHLLKEE